MSVTVVPATVTSIAGNSTGTVFLGGFLYSGTITSSTHQCSWGDGSPPAYIVISPPVDNFYSLIGSHTYSSSGTFNIFIYVQDTVNNFYIVIDSQAIVSVPTLIPSNSQPSLTVPVITNASVATFTSNNPLDIIENYIASIDWGDSSPISYGTITQPDGAGTSFIVSSSHIYSNIGTYSIKVIVSGNGTSVNNLLIQNICTCTYCGVVGTLSISPFSYTNINRKLVNVLLANIIDNSGNNLPPSSFTVNINWGDKKSSTGTIISTMPSQYSITGSHKYKKSKHYLITLTITNNSGVSPLSTTATTYIRI